MSVNSDMDGSSISSHKMWRVLLKRKFCIWYMAQSKDSSDPALPVTTKRIIFLKVTKLVGAQNLALGKDILKSWGKNKF